MCAPVYSEYHGLSSQVPIGIEAGLKHDSSIHCDELISLPKSALTQFIGSLGSEKRNKLNQALLAALGIELS
jgi:mRNA interferase MazF